MRDIKDGSRDNDPEDVVEKARAPDAEGDIQQQQGATAVDAATTEGLDDDDPAQRVIAVHEGKAPFMDPKDLRGSRMDSYHSRNGPRSSWKRDLSRRMRPAMKTWVSQRVSVIPFARFS